ncbi:hypothetical protein MMC09_003494 [Bachmanniomyces sp. S44760]|nr:hypothetical protein [Bachmanniomyces sp. S44760]
MAVTAYLTLQGKASNFWAKVMRPDSDLAIEALRAEIAAENREEDQRLRVRIEEMEHPSNMSSVPDWITAMACLAFGFGHGGHGIFDSPGQVFEFLGQGHEARQRSRY